MTMGKKGQESHQDAASVDSSASQSLLSEAQSTSHVDDENLRPTPTRNSNKQRSSGDLSPPQLQAGQHYSSPGAFSMTPTSSNVQDLPVDQDEEQSVPTPPRSSNAPVASGGTTMSSITGTQEYVLEASLVEVSDTPESATVTIIQATTAHNHRCWYITAILGVLLVTVAIAVGLGVGLPKQTRTAVTVTNDVGPTSSLWTLEPTLEPSLSISPNVISPLQQLLTRLPSHSVAAISNALSPQARAYEWLATDQDLDRFPLNRLVSRFALATLYYATSGEQWTNQAGWLVGDECDWYTTLAPSCSTSGVFYQLGLSENNLNGSLPPELGLLTELTAMEIRGNPLLVGPIPETIGELSALRLLDLYDNNLNGQLPVSLGKLSVLDFLGLELNEITGTLPIEMNGLVALTDMYLFDNKLEGILPGGWRIPEIKWLHLGQNFLSGPLPPAFDALSRLERLEIYSNWFTGRITPVMLEALQNTATHFDVGDNTFSGTIDSNIGLLGRLTHLDVFQNCLTGPIPTQLGLLTNLKSLYLEINLLTGTIPSELGNLSILEELNLEGNLLGGSVPTELCNMVSINGMRLTISCERVQCICGCICGNATNNTLCS